MSPEQIAEAEAFLADPDGEDCERFTSRYGRSLIEIAKAHWKTRAEGPAPVSARRSPADQDQQLVDQMRAAHARVWTEQGWRSEQSLRDGYEVWTLDSTGQRRIILARGCTPNVAALMCIVSTGLARLCDLADAPVSAPLDREAIARVIETTYWPLVDKWGRNTSNEYWNTRIEASLAKADAILALTGQQDQVGLTTPAVEGRGDRSEAIAYFEAFVKRKDEMDRMGYGLRAEEWPEFVATMRATLTGEGCGETYRNWHIRYDPPPIPSRASDWHFAHSDFDGAPDANDNRCGCAASLEAAKAEIDAWIEENFDCRCSAAIPADCMALTCKWRAT